jgi:hypothetical protein
VQPNPPQRGVNTDFLWQRSRSFSMAEVWELWRRGGLITCSPTGWPAALACSRRQRGSVLPFKANTPHSIYRVAVNWYGCALFIVPLMLLPETLPVYCALPAVNEIRLLSSFPAVMEMRYSAFRRSLGMSV